MLTGTADMGLEFLYTCKAITFQKLPSFLLANYKVSIALVQFFLDGTLSLQAIFKFKSLE